MLTATAATAMDAAVAAVFTHVSAIMSASVAASFATATKKYWVGLLCCSHLR